jgi:hypothetical protein
MPPSKHHLLAKYGGINGKVIVYKGNAYAVAKFR